MIQRQEAIWRGMTVSQAKNNKEHETHALTAKNLKPYFKKFPNPRSKERATKEEKCSHCKKLGHLEKKYWFLHPHLRPTH
jgi:hypothetical protein